MDTETIRLVNKGAIVVKPKQSFIDWANHFNDGGPTLELKDARRDPVGEQAFWRLEIGDWKSHVAS